MGHFLEALGPNVDIIKIGDDLGTQESLLMSPDMYRTVLKPIHADWIEFIKARTDAKLFFTRMAMSFRSSTISSRWESTF